MPRLRARAHWTHQLFRFIAASAVLSASTTFGQATLCPCQLTPQFRPGSNLEIGSFESAGTNVAPRHVDESLSGWPRKSSPRKSSQLPAASQASSAEAANSRVRDPFSGRMIPANAQTRLGSQGDNRGRGGDSGRSSAAVGGGIQGFAGSIGGTSSEQRNSGTSSSGSSFGIPESDPRPGNTSPPVPDVAPQPGEHVTPVQPPVLPLPEILPEVPRDTPDGPPGGPPAPGVSPMDSPVVPEPGSLGLLAIGGAVGGATYLKRRGKMNSHRQ